MPDPPHPHPPIGTSLASDWPVCVCRGLQELNTVAAAIQTVLSTPVSMTTALKGIQKILGKALPFKVRRSL